eukprot:CAMPEP_0172484138 /NCGR_PEP_ID=MMETSP1066-20121228/11451_1 /TAXON_ID=671091 /ORGANISM="Coscinodiscus wailesii, Strain CCMP2513" /LENGTH=461 /DNA_ID=CAMNT_0013248441 /DNA_START=164 /DNA_END=1550 /DNA_ORIENTATION=+
MPNTAKSCNKRARPEDKNQTDAGTGRPLNSELKCSGRTIMAAASAFSSRISPAPVAKKQRHFVPPSFTASHSKNDKITTSTTAVGQKRKKVRGRSNDLNTSTSTYANGLNYIPVKWNFGKLEDCNDTDDEEYAKFVRSLWCGSGTEDLASLMSLKSLPEEEDDDEASYKLPDIEDNDDDLDDLDSLLLPGTIGSPTPASTQQPPNKKIPTNSQSLITPSPNPNPTSDIKSPPRPLKSPTPDSIYNELSAELGGLLEEDLEAAVTTLINQPPVPQRSPPAHHPPPVAPKQKPSIIPVGTPQQLSLLRQLMSQHYQLLLQQSILAVRAAHQQKMHREKQPLRSQYHTNANAIAANSKIYLGSETADDLTEILDGAVGMLQDLDQHRKDAMRTSLQLDETSRLTRSQFRKSLDTIDRVTVFDVKGLSRLPETFQIIDNCVYKTENDKGSLDFVNTLKHGGDKVH